MADNKMLHTKAEVRSGSAQAQDGILEAVIGSTSVIDRMDDTINQEGWALKNFKKNPVILFGHNSNLPPIGKALKVWVQGKGKKAQLMFRVQFDLQDKFAAEIFRKVKDGFMNTVSVGFIPLEWEQVESDNFFGGHKFLKQELLELSFVPIPANPEALVSLRKLGKKFDFKPEESLEAMFPQVKGDDFLKEKKTKKVAKKKVKVKINDFEEPTITHEFIVSKKEYAKLKKEAEKKDTTVGDLLVERAEIEASKKSKKKVVKKVKESKRVIRYKDLGIAPESDAWDGPGEIAKAEVKDLKLMSTWVDKDEDVKSSYKLIHHKGDVDHKANWRGVAGAMASLLGASGGVEIPEDDQKSVYNHLKKHYVAYDKPAPEFKDVKDQVLANYNEEIHAIVLDREDKYAIRLMKKVLDEQKKAKKAVAKKVETKDTTQEKLLKALEVLNIALSHKVKDSEGGGGHK